MKRIRCFIIISLLLFTAVNLQAAENGYTIVSSQKIGKAMDEREKAGQVNPTMITVSSGGNLFILEEYENKFILIKSDKKYNIIKEIEVSRDKMGTRKTYESPDLTPGFNDDIILQSFIRNNSYRKENNTESFFVRKVLHFDKDLRTINNFEVRRIGSVLPPNGTRYYYMFGNAIHLSNKPLFLTDYVTKINRRGHIENKIKIKDRVIEQLLYDIINNSSIAIYSADKYITISNYDFTDINNYKLLSSEQNEKMKHNISLYILNPGKRSFKRTADLTEKVNSLYLTINQHPLNNFIITDAIRYDYKNSNAVFMMWEFDRFTTCGKIVSKHLVKYNMKSGKLKMAKLGPEFFERSFLAGNLDDIFYVFDWKASVLYGIKLK